VVRKLSLLPFALGLLLLTSSSEAVGQAKEAFSTLRTPDISCGGWLEQRQNKTYRDTFQWALGFLSGAAWSDVRGDFLADVRDSDGVLHWLDNYCRTYPTRRFLAALFAFTAEHSKK